MLQGVGAGVVFSHKHWIRCRFDNTKSTIRTDRPRVVCYCAMLYGPGITQESPDSEFDQIYPHRSPETNITTTSKTVLVKGWRGGGGISHLQSHPRSAQRVADGGMMYRGGQDL